jgi:hypothetical protein
MSQQAISLGRGISLLVLFPFDLIGRYDSVIVFDASILPID